jgi:hypothetical protein
LVWVQRRRRFAGAVGRRAGRIVLHAGGGIGFANSDDNGPLYVMDDTPAGEAHYRARFLFDPNGISGVGFANSGDNDGHQIFIGSSGESSPQDVVKMQLYDCKGPSCAGKPYVMRAGLKRGVDSVEAGHGYCAPGRTGRLHCIGQDCPRGGPIGAALLPGAQHALEAKLTVKKTLR